MSQNSPFDNLLREIKEGDPTSQSPPVESTFHAPGRIAKKLVIVWEDGRKASFLYIHMLAFMLNMDYDLHCLVLHFMAHKVNMKGFRLDLLFDRFVADEPFILAVVSERYLKIESDDDFLVTQAVIEP